MPPRPDPLSTYLTALNRNLASRIATEHTHRPALKTLLESLDPTVDAFNDPAHIEVGAPDFTVRRRARATDFPVGWIETKDIGEDLHKTEKSPQIQRYLRLSNVLLTDYLEFRWYVDGKRRLTASLGERSGKEIRLGPGGEDKVIALLTSFLSETAKDIFTPGELALRMAGLTHNIRNLILGSFEREKEGGKLHKEFQAFQETLIPDLKPDVFADMYAQTIAYGLFAARCQPKTTLEKFSRAHAAELIPKTNPFLRRLFREIAFELDERVEPFVDALVALLRGANIGSILTDFGKRTAKEDPVVHFYEDFLQAYDPKVRELRGVYYTPEPVVSYIVRSVDHLLKTKFNKPLGLADKDVLILDPACGTGTFLYYVIQHIYQTLVANGQKGQWDSYVSENLLKRIFGFELLMAPYAVAHLKLGLQLQELGYKFESDERLGIFLTNTLEEAIKRSELIFAQWIADEANAAADIKREKPIMVVLGNPPYSGHSANRSWVMVPVAESKKSLNEIEKPNKPTKKKERLRKKLTFIGKLLQDYYFVDGKPLAEKNPKWLQDDYVKFIRFGQERIDTTGYGILALITNHSYLDNPTFRGMRQQLKNAFSKIRILDLHGNKKKREASPDGSEDKNVFDIQQGVAIGFFTKEEQCRTSTKIYHADLWGPRKSKYRFLETESVETTDWSNIKAESPLFLLTPQSTGLSQEYEKGWILTDIFPFNSVGIVTARDRLTIRETPDQVWETVKDFVGLEEEEARSKYSLGPDVRDWKVRLAQRDIQDSGPQKNLVRPILYRPFDVRFTYYTGQSRGFLCMPRPEVTNEMLTGKNLALLVGRAGQVIGPGEWDIVLCSRFMTEFNLFRRGGNNVFPLRVGSSSHRQAGLRFSSSQKANLGHEFQKWLQSRFPSNTPPAEQIFHYVYAVLFSRNFRKRYNAFLKLGFPRIPFTSNNDHFRDLIHKGSELVSLHLMESQKLSKFITRYEQPGDHTVEKVRYIDANPKAGIKSGRVYINATQFFDGVPKDVWEFHIGGYQVLQKWLKDRKGRQLSSDDIDHYQKIIVALSETIRLMKEIDALIPSWPLP